MAKVKASIPQGTRDFGPEIVRKRNFIFNTIRSVFEVYGFQPIETPAMENIETLMGKYGEEGDKLIFRILDSGNPFTEEFFNEIYNYLVYDSPKNKSSFTKIKSLTSQNDSNENNEISQDSSRLTSPNSIQDSISNDDKNKVLLPKLKSLISEKALRYDLTIPFARYVAMNYGKLTFPFRRYQIQQVWRGDKPQKGRYREFYQCDADIVGSDSLLNEVELTIIYSSVFKTLKIPSIIKVNNRKILLGIAEYCGCLEKFQQITSTIDKIDKIGKNGVKLELSNLKIPQEKIDNIIDCLFIEPSEDYIFTKEELIDKYSFTEEEANKHIRIQNSPFRDDIEVLNCLRGRFLNDFEETITKPISQIGIDGIDEILEIYEILIDTNPNIHLRYDVSLARGLNYYTGTIFEVQAMDVKIGSIGGGGRYDNLTGLFGVPDVPGVGISFGVDRIYDVMEELKLFPDELRTGTQILFLNQGGNESKIAFGLMQKLRQQNISCELYHINTKIEKQFKYAENNEIPYVVFLGRSEFEKGIFTIKNIKNGKQQSFSIEQFDILSFFKINQNIDSIA